MRIPFYTNVKAVDKKKRFKRKIFLMIHEVLISTRSKDFLNRKRKT